MALSEQDLQIACVKWCQTKGVLVWHTANGGARSGREAMKFKSMGVLAGVPDLFLPALHMFVELKSPTGKGWLSGEQRALMAALETFGYTCVVTSSFEAFKEAVVDRLEINAKRASVTVNFE